MGHINCGDKCYCLLANMLRATTLFVTVVTISYRTQNESIVDSLTLVALGRLFCPKTASYVKGGDCTDWKTTTSITWAPAS